MTTTQIDNQVSEFTDRFQLVKEEISKVIVGNDEIIDGTLISLIAKGHVLLEGIPGIGKTKIVATVADVLHLTFSRIQFTPDLLPSDITGVSIYNQKTSEFEFRQGPIISQLVLADEINRATPKTQSALLEAMDERQVTVDGVTHTVPKPFTVMATQNSIEYEGTFPLPEAQLDRFFMQVDVDYPDLEGERQIIVNTTGPIVPEPVQVMDAKALIEAQGLVRHVPVGESVAEAILELVRAGRPETSDIEDVKKNVSWGPGPRATQALMLGVRARSVIEGRLAPSIDDVLALVHPILRHRMALTFSARAEGVTLRSIIDRLCDRIA